MNVKTFSAYILFVLMLSACATDESAKGDIQLHNTLSKTIPIDGNVPVSSFCLKYKDGLLHYLDRDNNRILKFDMKGEELHSSLQFEYEGDKGVGKVTGFTLLENGEILLSSSGKPLFYRVNGQTGDLLGKVDFGKGDLNQPPVYSPLSSMFYNDAVFADGKHYILQQLYAQGDPAQLRQRAANFKAVLSYGKNGDVRFLNLGIPKDYFEKGQVLKESSLASDGKRLVYSLRCSHDIQVYDIQSGKLSQYPAQSAAIRDFKPMKEGGVDGLHKHIALNASYESVIYDPFRNVYYRIARLPAKDPADVKHRELHYRLYPDDFTVLIIDAESFKQLGETRFDGRHYNMYNFFVAEEGLFFSKGNPDAPDYNEENLVFDCFTWSKT